MDAKLADYTKRVLTANNPLPRTNIIIKYQFTEERAYAIHYAKELNRPIILSILNRGFVENRDEARALSTFFWDMVDKSIENENIGVKYKWPENTEFWNEKLLQTFSGHLEAIGFLDVWDEEVDKQ